MTNETTLPELPEPKYMVTKYRVVGDGDGTMLNPRRGDRVADGLKPAGFTADQMHAYAQQATADLCAKLAELESKWLAEQATAMLHEAELEIEGQKQFILSKENFTLSANQCCVKGGLVGDEHGNQYCSLQRAAIDAARSTK